MTMWHRKNIKKPEDESFGLKVLYVDENAKVDIIFVHGLTGGREKTWTAKGAEGSWPEMLLPQIVPRSRILTYGYDADVVRLLSVVSKARLGNHAEGLLEAVASHRESDSTNDRPIFFVAHSLGGLVCEEALNKSKTSADNYLKNILECTWGIAFLGTPHSGSDQAGWAGIATKMIGLVKQTNKDIIEPLKRNSYELERIEGDFQTMIRARHNEKKRVLHIVSFYETNPIPGIGPIVEINSAKLAGYTNTPIYADHVGMTKFVSLEDPGFVAVSRPLQRWAKECKNLSGGISIVPYPRNPLFVGRDDILRKIEEFFSKDLHKKLALYGLGGIGKSQILLEYAYRHMRSAVRGPVFWVSAVSHSRFLDHYREIAQKLKILTKDNNREMNVPRLVKEALEKKEFGEWLLIIDNADEMSVLFDTSSDYGKSLFNYIPENPNGSVLYSTRSRHDAQRLAGEILRIGELSADESHKLLSTNMTDIDVIPEVEEEWTELLDELAYLPLAIVQAASYMKMQAWSVATYLAFYRKDMCLTMLEHEVQVLGSEQNSSQIDLLEERSKNAALRTFIITFEQIEHRDSRAANILCLMACYHWQNVPFDLLQDVGAVEAISLTLPDADIPGPFAASIGTLTSFSLVTTTVDHRSYTIHRMVKLSALEWLRTRGDGYFWAQKALVSLVKPYSPNCYQNASNSGRLIPHIEPVLSLFSKWPEIITTSACLHLEAIESIQDRYLFLPHSSISGLCRLLCSCAEHLLNEGRYKLAEKYTVMACVIFDFDLKDPGSWGRWEGLSQSEADKIGSFTLYMLSQLTLASGKSMIAMYIARQAWLSFRTAMDARHCKTITLGPTEMTDISWNTLDPLANLECVATHEQLLLVDMMNQEASAGLVVGITEAAKDLSIFIASWSEDRKSLPPFATVTNIALSKLHQGPHDETEILFHQLVSRAIKQFGPGSLETLQTKTYLATVKYFQGCWEDARILNQEVLELRESILNPSHPRLIENRNLSALILWGRGKHLEARDCLKALVELSDSSLGSRNPMAFTLLNNLACVLFSIYEDKAAEQYLHRAFENCKKLAGTSPLLVQKIRFNLYKVLYCLGKTGYEWIQPEEPEDLIENVPLLNSEIDAWIKRKEAAVWHSWEVMEYDAEGFLGEIQKQSWYKGLQRCHDQLLHDQLSSSIVTPRRQTQRKLRINIQLPKLQKLLTKRLRQHDSDLELCLDRQLDRTQLDSLVRRVDYLEPIGFDKLHSLTPTHKVEDPGYPLASRIFKSRYGKIPKSLI